MAPVLAVTLVSTAVPLAQGAQEPVDTTRLASEGLCRPTATTTEPDRSLRVVGALEIPGKTLMGPSDTLLLSTPAGGTARPGEIYVVRRVVQSFGAQAPDAAHPAIVQTAGLVRLAEIRETLATAEILYTCDGIFRNDYLEPPPAPDTAATSSVVPAATTSGTVIGSGDGRLLAAPRSFVTVDLGSSHGVAPGLRLAVRRPSPASSELTALVATLEVVSVGPSTSTARVLSGRDAVRRGDQVTPLAP